MTEICKCGHSEMRHEIPIILGDGKMLEMRCYDCSCENYKPLFVHVVEAS